MTATHASLLAICLGLVACSASPTTRWTDDSSGADTAPSSGSPTNTSPPDAALGIAPDLVGGAMKPLPRGLLRVIGYGRYSQLPPDTASFFAKYPFVHGMAVVETWRNLEAKRGQATLDTSYLDMAVQWARQVHQPLVLLIVTGGTARPDWLAGPALSVSGGGTAIVPWDRAQNDAWLATSAKLAARYDDDDAVAGIYVAGVQAEYPEMFLERGPYTDATATAPDLPLDLPSGTVFSDAWVRVLSGMAQQWRRTWLVNMIDTIAYWDSPPDGYDRTMLTVAREIDAHYPGRATMGITNMGYETVVAPPGGVVSPKYAQISAPNHVAPLVYELGPLKQDGGAGEVKAALDYACAHIQPRVVITQPGTWDVATYPSEMAEAVAACREWR